MVPGRNDWRLWCPRHRTNVVRAEEGVRPRVATIDDCDAIFTARLLWGGSTVPSHSD